MAWRHTAQPQRRPLDTPVRPAGTGGGTVGPPGPAGPTGPAGADGATGPAGPGVAPGGTTGQHLAKTSSADYATTWVTPGVVTSASAPATPLPGDLWWRTTDGNLYIYYNDGTSTQWVPAMASVGTLAAPAAPPAVLVVSDPFESYTAGAQISAPWTGISNSPVVTAQAHGGTKSLAIGTGGNGSSATLPLGTSLTKWTLDVWLWVNATGDTTNQYIGLKTSAASGSAIVLNIGASGAGLVGQWAGVTWFTFSTTIGVWHHCVLTVFQDAVAGTASLTIDGVSMGTYAGDTRDNFAHTSVEQVLAVGSTIGPSPPAEIYVDDLIVYNNA